MNTLREHLVRKATRYLQEHLSEDVTVQDIADSCGVATRTLQIAFQDVLDLSPKAWLTRLRLRHARQILLLGSTSENVTSAALSSGFSHLGRFSQLYWREFGEAPSQTLRQAQDLARLIRIDRPARNPTQNPTRFAGNTPGLVSAEDKFSATASALKTLDRPRGDLVHWRQLHELLHGQLGYRRMAIILKRRSDGRPFIFSHCRHGMGDEAFGLDMRRVNGVLESSRGVVHSVLNSGNSRIVGDVWQSPDYAALDPRIRAELCVALVHKGEVIGAINVESEHRDPFDVHDLSLASRLAAAAVGELNAARNQASLGLTDRL